MTLERREAVAVLPALGDTAAQGSSRRVSGLGVPFNRRSRDMGFREQFDPGAFDAQAAEDGFAGVQALFWHSEPLLLGSVRAGTMSVTVTRAGLDYSILVPRSMPYPVELVERGDIGGASVGFYALADEWSTLANGEALRTVLAARLAEISLVPVAAYADTTAMVRAAQPSSPRRRATGSVDPYVAKARRRLVQARMTQTRGPR